jgi:RHS repeat-associated protein
MCAIFRIAIAAAFLCAVPLPVTYAAALDGSALIEIQDPSGGLSWDDGEQAKALSISCWFKISIPSSTSISQNMTILVDRTTGDNTDTHACLIWLNVSTGNVEFSTKGASDSFDDTLIGRPYLERWYHVAVIRNGTQFTGYVDGREVFRKSKTVGDAGNTDGVSIGGWSGGKYFYGEIQEVSIFQFSLNQQQVYNNMFQDLNPADWDSLKGYYKLAYTGDPADRYRNSATAPPDQTENSVKTGSGEITFEETNEQGEQSLFDARKNGGRDALVPLSGAYTWTRKVFQRPTPGIPLEFTVGYNSANSFNRFTLGSFDPLASSSMGSGWRHSFEIRALPARSFSPVNSLESVGILSWTGNVEVWDYDDAAGAYQTRHKEYRGELRIIGFPGSPTAHIEWTTPDRIVYKFMTPFAGDALLQGRLVQIRDFNQNAISVELHETGERAGKIKRIVDTGGGIYDFTYNGQGLLQAVAFDDWSADFTYNEEARLATAKVSAPESYGTLNTEWQFTYYDDVHEPPNLLSHIKDPRGNTAFEIHYDKYGRKTEVRDALGRATNTAYNSPERRQLTETDPEGNTWILTHDRKHRLVASSTPLEDTTGHEYDEFGNVSKMTDPKGYHTRFSYDNRANPLTVTNALGEVTRTAYHPFFNVAVERTDAAGWMNHYMYDDVTGDLLLHSDEIGTLVSYTYDNRGLVQSSTDANSNETTFAYNPEGFRTSRTDPSSDGTGHTWTWTYNEWGWPLSATNPLSETTTTSYDINGRAVKRIDALLREYIMEYDANGNLSRSSDGKSPPDRKFTEFAYDVANQKESMTDRSGKIWRYTYTNTGNVHTVEDPLTNVITREYDDADRLSRQTDPVGNSTVNQYDKNSNRTVMVDAEGREWKTDYDRLNRVVASTDPLGNTTRKTYDATGRLKTVVSPRRHTQEHLYDGRGRLTIWVDANGYVWGYEYDGNGNIIAITDALGGVYQMSYGSRNERVEETNQDEKTWTYIYDALMRVAQQTDPNGLTRTSVHDAGGRVQSVSFSSGRTDVFAYDKNDNMKSITRTQPGYVATSLLTYDGMDRVITYQDTYSNTVGYGYDDAGRLSFTTYPGNKTLTRSYYGDGRLEKLTDWAARETTYAYDKAGRLTERAYPNGITQENVYDSAGRLLSLRYKKPDDSDLIAYEYSYDPNGNLTGSLDAGTIDWTPPESIDVTATHTGSGRLVTRTDAAAPDGSRDFAYTYDEAGNMVRADSATQIYELAYDEDNRVIALTATGAVNADITNRYDALGRRVARVADGTETRYVLDLSGGMERILCDTTASGVVMSRYVHDATLAYREDADGTMVFFHADAAGNIIATTDNSDNVRNQCAYTPYGAVLQATGPADNPYRFAGSLGVMEELPDLYFMRARYYSAKSGVFLSTDPFRPIGPRWRPLAYTYGRRSPLLYTDPEGRVPFLTHLVAFGGGVLVGFGKGAVGAMLPAAAYEFSGDEDAKKAVNQAGWADEAPVLASIVLGDPTFHAAAGVGGYVLGDLAGGWLVDSVTHLFAEEGRRSSEPNADVWKPPPYQTRGTDRNFGKEFRQGERIDVKIDIPWSKAMHSNETYATDANGPSGDPGGGGGGGGGGTEVDKGSSGKSFLDIVKDGWKRFKSWLGF